MNAVSKVDWTAMLSISTDCTCEVYDDNDELIPTNHCYGCYSDAKADIIAELGYWLARNDVGAIEATASRMNWNGVSGVAYLPSDAEPIFDLLTLRGDYRLEFYWDAEDKLTARRWSHDEPMGTGLFTFTPVPYDAMTE